MWLELFLCLVLAHLIADFLLQTNKICKNKAEKRWRSLFHYGHSVVVFGLSWLVTWDVRFNAPIYHRCHLSPGQAPLIGFREWVVIIYGSDDMTEIEGVS